MGRKTISTYKLNKIKSLLSEGKTSKEISSLLKISTATVSNYRVYFKKKGEIDLSKNNDTASNTVEGNKINKNTSIKSETPSESFKSNYSYIVNGTELRFKHKPKSILIGKNELVIEI